MPDFLFNIFLSVVLFFADFLGWFVAFFESLFY